MKKFTRKLSIFLVWSVPSFYIRLYIEILVPFLQNNTGIRQFTQFLVFHTCINSETRARMFIYI